LCMPIAFVDSDSFTMDSSFSAFPSCVKNTFVHVVIPGETEQMTRSSSCPPDIFRIISEAKDAKAEEISQGLSVGSALHFAGDCKPCAWRWKTGGCANQLSCRFCHICSDGALKKRRRAKLHDVKETARNELAQRQEEEQALKLADQQKKKHNSLRWSIPVPRAQKETFKLSAVRLEDLFHELKRRNQIAPNRSLASSFSAASTAPSGACENRFATASSASSTASPRSFSPSSNNTAVDPVALQDFVRPWNRDRASRDWSRAQQKVQ